MKVWIEQEFCTGDGLCESLCPEMFEMHDDGLAYVRQEGGSDEGSARVDVPDQYAEAVLDAQAQCAGECIYVER
jgi:ferredoxin